MAVQIPDPGTGNGQTGDNEYVFRKKVKDNFSDQTNAASKLVGTGAEEVPQNKHLGSAAYRPVGTVNTGLLQFGDMGLGNTYQSNSTTTATSPDEISAGFFTTSTDSPLRKSPGGG